ncbi:hypothetical protein SLA2020_313170 [Shorea laevis]
MTAFNLYTETLGYKIHDVEAKYYADGEDAYDMRKQPKGKQSHHHQPGGGCCSGKARGSKGTQTRGDSKPESKASTKSDTKAG